jgi:hypothetical protein
VKLKAIILSAFLLMTAGCGSASGPSSTRVHRAAAASRTARAKGISMPYRLYTHCGIEWARIDGTFWRARQPLSDGSGNPPPGWGSPYQQGTLVFLNSNTAEFTSRAGDVTFTHTAHQGPPAICS